MRIAAIIAVVTALCHTANAQDISADIQHGIELYEDLEYDQAIAALDAALAKPELDRTSRITGYKYLALSYVAVRKTNAAKDALRRLLEIDRKFQLDRTESQTARNLLAEVRDAMPHEVSIRQTPSPSAQAGSPFKVDVEVTDEDGVHRGVVLYHRRQGATEYSAVQAAPLGGNRYTATISGAFVEEPSLQYYVVTTSPTGRVLANSGTAEQPMTVSVAPAPKPKRGGSVFSSKWFWAATGAVAVAGAATTFLLLRSDEPPAPGAQINIVVQFQ